MQRLLEHLLRQPQAGGQGGGLGLGRVAAEHGEPLLEMTVPVHSGVAAGRIRVGHLRFGLAYPDQQGVEPAGRQHPVHRECIEVAHPGVLGQIPDGPVVADASGCGQGLAG